MDEWDDDAYGVIYDEHDRERSFKSSNGKPSGNSCCGSIFLIIMIGLVIAIVI
ncbi:MAG: hypothetical protein IJ258_01620 [Methanobrevibacter sp.]|uniref:hypothetical protein n=1 Tax=Methanobrevibacter sp. TaxID=66852 RepID=UPI0025CCC34D|nr:hypothetical protein [Methanobrevibacter sp.]MBQ8016782.1 hypothetical protein [Methanobrevibacter sp.]